MKVIVCLDYSFIIVKKKNGGKLLEDLIGLVLRLMFIWWNLY